MRSKYLLAVTELPYGVTTESLIESILAANAKGKIKVKHVDDNTADKVEILIHLPQGAEPEKVIQQLYVFTSCQVQLNPAACVIVRNPETGDDKPHFLGVRDILKTQRGGDEGAAEARTRNQARRTRTAVALGFAGAHFHRGAHLSEHREIEDVGERARGDPRRA